MTEPLDRSILHCYETDLDIFPTPADYVSQTPPTGTWSGTRCSSTYSEEPHHRGGQRCSRCTGVHSAVRDDLPSDNGGITMVPQCNAEPGYHGSNPDTMGHRGQ